MNAAALVRELRALGPLSKQLTIHTYDGTFDGEKAKRKVSHALVRISEGEIGAVVSYDALCRMLDRLRGQVIQIDTRSDGISLSHARGICFFNHVHGFEPSASIEIGK